VEEKQHVMSRGHHVRALGNRDGDRVAVPVEYPEPDEPLVRVETVGRRGLLSTADSASPDGLPSSTRSSKPPERLVVVTGLHDYGVRLSPADGRSVAGDR
jgi:hypothetical protein